MWRVLYVDDEPDLRDVARMSLELDPEIEVRCAASGQEALAEVRAWHPHLVLLDVMMPVMDGPTTLRRMREVIDEQPIVLFCTARASNADRGELEALCPADIITKPFDPMRLAPQVKTHLADTYGAEATPA